MVMLDRGIPEMVTASYLWLANIERMCRFPSLLNHITVHGLIPHVFISR